MPTHLRRTRGDRPLDPRSTGGGSHHSVGLSPREIEVLRLLAAGLTDREIADRLFLSARTVESHLASARRKLGVSNRTEAATAAYRLGLTGSETGSGRDA